MTRLYLVRHGENPANITREFSHRKVDYSLTAKGVLQAEQTAGYFRDRNISAIYASPLKRAHETAEIIAAELNLPVTVMEAFREVNVGDLEGQPPTDAMWAQHDQVIADWWAGDVERSFPGGENYLELCARVQAALAEIVARWPDQTVIIAAHGGVIGFPLPAFCPNVDRDWLLAQENGNCSITEVDAYLVDGEVQGELIRWASCAHLSGAAAKLVSGRPPIDGLHS